MVDLNFTPDEINVVPGAFAGTNNAAGAVVFSVPANPTIADTFTANGGTGSSIANLAGLLNGVYYIEAVSADGEIRGQITPGDVQVVRIEMTEDQVIGDSIPGGEGTAFFTFDAGDAADTPVVNVVDLNFTPDEINVVPGAPAGLNNAGGAVVFSLDNNGDGTFTANSGTGSSIANLAGLLNGVYYIEAVSTDGEIRGQITPRDLQVVRLELQPEQVVPTDTPNGSPTGPTTALEGGSAVGFFTFDETNSLAGGANDGNALANNPIVVVNTDFAATSVEVIVGGGFAGENSPAVISNRIVLSSVNADSMVFTANTPGTAELDLQAIGALAGLINGVYNIAATDANNAQVRGQITPRGTFVFVTALAPADGSELGTGVGALTVSANDTVVVNASVDADITPADGTLVIGSDTDNVIIPLTAEGSMLSSGAPVAVDPDLFDLGNTLTVNNTPL